jgi:hypothetical protein
MAKKKDEIVAFLPLNTPLIIRAFHKESGQHFDKKSTYSEWLQFKKNPQYRYIALQVI